MKVRLLNVTRQTVPNAICCFKELGNDGRRPENRRKRTVNTSRYSTRVQRNPRISMRQIVRDMGISDRSARRVVKTELGLKPYKLRKVQPLTEKTTTRTAPKMLKTFETGRKIWCVDAPSTSAIVKHRQYPKSVMSEGVKQFLGDWGGLVLIPQYFHVKRTRDPLPPLQCPRNRPLRQRRPNSLGSITFDGLIHTYIFERGSLTAVRYKDERAHLVDEFLESEDIHRMDWPVRSPDLILIEHAWDPLTIATRKPSLRTLQGLKTELLNESATR
ncbi:DDE_3 domain-containing protein [Trichonephila clavipes]|nr:DDE_3 domain-containing protein [Trichonephila clavipes]